MVQPAGMAELGLRIDRLQPGPDYRHACGGGASNGDGCSDLDTARQGREPRDPASPTPSSSARTCPRDSGEAGADVLLGHFSTIP